MAGCSVTATMPSRDAQTVRSTRTTGVSKLRETHRWTAWIAERATSVHAARLFRAPYYPVSRRRRLPCTNPYPPSEATWLGGSARKMPQPRSRFSDIHTIPRLGGVLCFWGSLKDSRLSIRRAWPIRPPALFPDAQSCRARPRRPGSDWPCWRSAAPR